MPEHGVPETGEGQPFVVLDDCRHFVGGLPCKYWRPCAGCGLYDPVQRRVLIAMLGLLGDMLIASALPKRLKEAQDGTHVSWLVSEQSATLVRLNPYVDRVMVWNWETSVQLAAESFDLILCFEREPAVAGLLRRVPSKEYRGLAYGGPHNALYSVGDAAEHFFKMNTWNDFRTRQNSMTWTQLYFSVAGLEYRNDPYVLKPPKTSVEFAAELARGFAGNPLVCLNIGGSIQTKRWPPRHWVSLGDALLSQGADVLVAAGPDEANEADEIARAMQSNWAADRVSALHVDLEKFVALPRVLACMVTGDSLGFHLAHAFGTPCVVLFGPSPRAEVLPPEHHGVVALGSTKSCSPCAHQVVCGGLGGCMEDIHPVAVLERVRSLLGQAGSRSPEAN